MADETKPPVAKPVQPPPGKNAVETYNVLQDKIGGVPNVRWKDNVFQAAFVAATTLVAVGVGYALGGQQGLLVGALAGIVGGGLLSGLVLMVVGLVRKS